MIRIVDLTYVGNKILKIFLLHIGGILKCPLYDKFSLNLRAEFMKSI